MQRVEVEARDDTTNREGGHAIILLRGVDRLDEDVTFFLRPLDAVGLDDGLGVLEHELRAVSIRRVDKGVELVVGPEVTEHPALQPGSSIEIELPETGLWSEFQWPVVTARARPKRAKIVANRPPSEFPHETLDTGSTRTEAANSLVTTTGLPSVTRAPTPVEPRQVQPRHERDDHAGPMRGGFVPAAPASPEPRMGGRPTSAKPAASVNSVKEDATSMKNPQPAYDATAVDPAPHPTEGEGPDYVVFYPYARGGKIGAGTSGTSTRRTASLLPTTRLGAAAMAVGGVLALQALFWLGNNGGQSAGTANLAVTSNAGPEGSMFDVLSVGPVSPRGVQARDVSAAKALENAQAALLTPGATRDAEEASYWLRRYLLGGGSDERTRRVLTQLGTTFADATNRQPDYGKARQVWELASAFGDPIAMCFVGTLNENGLGVPSDRKLALQWYERAKQAGGCPAVDDSIARVKK